MRARAVAERCGLPLVPRAGSLEQTFEAAHVDLLYIVGRHLEELRSRTERIAVHAGLLRTRAHQGRSHPLVRAVAPDGGSVRRVADATLGLGVDALHLAAALEAEVIGAEASPVVYSLLEEGLARLGREPAPVGAAAGRVKPRLGRAVDVLRGEGRFDVVVLSPMFEAPRKAPPGYAVFRRVAVHDPLDAATLEVARSIADRVVLKANKDAALPACWPTSTTCIPGRAVDYWVVT